MNHIETRVMRAVTDALIDAESRIENLEAALHHTDAARLIAMQERDLYRAAAASQREPATANESEWIRLLTVISAHSAARPEFGTAAWRRWRAELGVLAEQANRLYDSEHRIELRLRGDRHA